jgi:hypothetical protein
VNENTFQQIRSWFVSFSCPLTRGLRDFVGIVGNQTTRAGRFLRELNLPCDILATSDDWDVTKPDVAFFVPIMIVSSSGRPETLDKHGVRPYRS